MAKDDKLNWVVFTAEEVRAISKDMAKAFDGMAAARKAFEAAFTESARKAGNVPDGHTLKFNYRYGNVNAAIVKEGATTAAGEAKGGFAKLALPA